MGVDRGEVGALDVDRVEQQFAGLVAVGDLDAVHLEQLAHKLGFAGPDELFAAVRSGTPPQHDGHWARSTLQVCLALLQSSREQRDVELDAAR